MTAPRANCISPALSPLAPEPGETLETVASGEEDEGRGCVGTSAKVGVADDDKGEDSNGVESLLKSSGIVVAATDDVDGNPPRARLDALYVGNEYEPPIVADAASPLQSSPSGQQRVSPSSRRT